MSTSGLDSASVNEPDARAAECAEVGEATERDPEVGGERPHVGATAALDLDVGFRVGAGLEPDHVEAIDVHGTRRALDLLARSRQLVEATAADLHRRHHRRELFDVTDEARQRVFDVVARDGHRSLVEHLTGGVERAGGDAEHDPTFVGLPRLRQVAQEARGATEPHEQHAGGVGVERARVADLALAEGLAQLGDHVVRREPGRLVDDDETVLHRGQPTSPEAQSAPRMFATTVGMSSVDSNPAAKR